MMIKLQMSWNCFKGVILKPLHLISFKAFADFPWSSSDSSLSSVLTCMFNCLIKTPTWKTSRHLSVCPEPSSAVPRPQPPPPACSSLSLFFSINGNFPSLPPFSHTHIPVLRQTLYETPDHFSPPPSSTMAQTTIVPYLDDELLFCLLTGLPTIPLDSRPEWFLKPFRAFHFTQSLTVVGDPSPSLLDLPSSSLWLSLTRCPLALVASLHPFEGEKWLPPEGICTCISSAWNLCPQRLSLLLLLTAQPCSHWLFRGALPAYHMWHVAPPFMPAYLWYNMDCSMVAVLHLPSWLDLCEKQALPSLDSPPSTLPHL